MIYRELGKTGLMVSEIGLGGEWLERHNTEECIEVIKTCEKHGINIEGLEDVNLDTIKELLTIDTENWKKEAEGIEGFYGELTRVPAELYAQLETLKKNLDK